MAAPQLSEELAAKAQRAAARLTMEVSAEALRVFALSDFASRQAALDEAWLAEQLADHGFSAPFTRDQVLGALAEELPSAQDMATLQRVVRRWRNRFQLWVVWRHLLGWADTRETCTALSLLADTFIDETLGKLHGWAVTARGTPTSAAGEPQRLIVLALGKLGAGELNLSSDVDLVFAYGEPGQTERGESNQEFFLRLGRQLIEALDAVTEHGFAFRVDMRLRPFGASGPLVMHAAAIEDYYAAHGRDWERYALIKARPCAGDLGAGDALLAGLRPFVYRRYLDFGALEALRQMKARIVAERNKPADVKLGPGGIREIEFAVQVLQLIWGGRVAELREASVLKVLPALAERGLLAWERSRALADAYTFLRDTEHSLQAEGDRQTQTLPTSPLGRERLALAMGFAGFASFAERLEQHRAEVSACFEAVIAAPEQSDTGLWPTFSLEALAEAGFRDVARAEEVLRSLLAARDRPSVGAEGHARLDALMPRLLSRVLRAADPDLALARVVPVLKAVLRRSAYLVLLYENPDALARLVELTHASGWVADELARRPAFFDALLDTRTLSHVPTTAELRGELQPLLQAHEMDFESRVDVLREFKAHRVFDVSVAEVAETLPLMNVSDYLSFLAEALLAEALGLAWAETATRFPEYPAPEAFVIVGYGKLGGLELGPGSDLDLVFVHDLPSAAGQFLHRLVRRLLHVLTVQTYLGTLYEVDMRLRPSGNAGTMMSSLEAFADYQRRQAWLWEHQALVRARVVAGDTVLAERFAAVRREILCQPRDPEEVRAEVLQMRRRMAAHHDADDDVKRGPGGIVDIEFMVQYLVLALAHEHPSLTEFTDNVRILETAERLQLLPASMAQNLREAYLGLRSLWHRSVLALSDVQPVDETLARYRDDVRAAWVEIFGEAR